MDHQIDFQLVADLLGVDRSILPAKLQDRLVEPARQAARILLANLTDDEWAIVATAIPPMPVPKAPTPDGDRLFVEAARWHLVAQQHGLGWGRLPEGYGPQSSRRHRWYRWALLGYWSVLADRLEGSELRREIQDEFNRIAAAAERYKARILEQRARLTSRP